MGATAAAAAATLIIERLSETAVAESVIRVAEICAGIDVTNTVG